MTKADIRTYYPVDVIETLDGFPVTRSARDFEDYQWWMSDLMFNNDVVLLGAFMGSGKTATALHAARKLLDQGKIKKVLVVAPLNVAKDTWPDELLVWDFARRFTYTVIVGDAEQREEAARKDVELYIVNRENYGWLYEMIGVRGWKFELLIYDEASRLKEGDKKTKPTVRKDGSVGRSRRSHFGYLTQTRHKFKRVWELSGTPAPNGVIDLWGPVYILDQGKRLGASRTKFRERWFRYDQYARTYEPFDHSEKEITDRLKGVFWCLKEEDYLDLPPLKVVDRIINLSPKHMAQYREFERTLALEEYDVDAVNNGVLCNKLLQFANGSIYAEADEQDPEDFRTKSVAKFVHNDKLDALGSIYEEAGGRPLLIAYSYKFDVQAIKKRFPKFRIFGESANDLRDWNRGKLPAMILHPASAGHGLNFQQGSNLAVWYGLNWSLELYQQFNKRLHRRGQEADSVWLYRILARGTNDIKVAERLEQRGVTQDRITDAVRVRVADIRDWNTRRAA